MKKKYYIPIEVWSRIDTETVECYSIFQRISDGKYAVQSKDVYRKKNMSELRSYFRNQRLILFMEDDIDNRALFKDTIDASITVFNDSFKD